MKRRGQLRDESGVALVEFALVLPLLLLLLFGMLDFGKAFNYWIDETHLANETARWAAVNNLPGGTDLCAYAKSQADTPELRSGGTSSIPGSGAAVSVTYPVNGATGTSGQVGDPVQVTVSVSYHWLPFIGTHLGAPSVTIQGTSTMRLEAKGTLSC